MAQAADLVTGQDVRDAVFPKAPVFKRGYHDGTVDELLDRIATTIDGMDST
jgi:DivIVA domain-containing protein